MWIIKIIRRDTHVGGKRVRGTHIGEREVGGNRIGEEEWGSQKPRGNGRTLQITITTIIITSLITLTSGSTRKAGKLMKRQRGGTTKSELSGGDWVTEG